MELLSTVTVIFSIITGIAFLAYLDKRFSLGLNEQLSADGWFSTTSQTSTTSSTVESMKRAHHQELDVLRKRIETLEKILTDPAEQLKRDIDNLR